jgi:hypothetical protein
LEASAFDAEAGVGCALGVRLLLDEVASGEVTPPIAAGLTPELAAEFEVDWGVADADGSGLCARARDPKIAPPRMIAISPQIPTDEIGVLPRGRIE